MLIPKKTRLLVYRHLFQEGVVIAKKDLNAPSHIKLNAPNLHVVKLLQALKAKALVTETFSWQYFYWYLTNDGINYLREYLNLAADVVPNTLKPKKTTRPAFNRERRFDGPREGQSASGYERKGSAPEGFRPRYRDAASRGGDRGAPRRGFGRGSAPRQN
uniref:Plectin/eS10 N-terminal domain-containing protein n=1 Tax=Lotus japonicus TaxID=34305 RepID=I3T483_LOTJA|nr:unknown [Lotus japonicus]